MVFGYFMKGIDKVIICGIDPGYAIVGWGMISYQGGKFAPLCYGAITTPAEMAFSKRLRHVYDELSLLFTTRRPDAVAIEKLFFHTNQKTVIDVAQARGVITVCAENHDLPIYEYTPLQVKSAVCGYGRAEKPQVMEMTKRLLRLQKMPKLDDTSDALAIAICHGQSSGMKRRMQKSQNIK